MQFVWLMGEGGVTIHPSIHPSMAILRALPSSSSLCTKFPPSPPLQFFFFSSSFHSPPLPHRPPFLSRHPCPSPSPPPLAPRPTPCPPQQKWSPLRTWFFGFSATASPWNADQSPYDTLGVELNVDEEGIKIAYRGLAKKYHPDVYDGSVELEEGETVEARFIKIQAAYELLMNKEQRRQYDYDNRINPLKASKAWTEWLLKKKKAFEQRGDMAVTAWAEQQQREMSLKARRLSKNKMDPEEQRRILAREKQAAVVNVETTLKRHTLVLKKRDLMRRKTDADAQKKLVQQLLAAEGLELDDESE